MPLLVNIGRLLVCPADGEAGELRPIDGAALAWQGGKIVWVGRQAELAELDPGAVAAWGERRDVGGRLVVPGLVDCHTHLVFGGNRSDEVERRLGGATYLEIAAAGGGIARTVAATRATAEDMLYERARTFLGAIAATGVTTVEGKSGYGLSLEHELEQLRVYRRLNEAGPIRVVPTLLAAHVVPKEWRDDRSRYVDIVCEEIIPRVAAEQLACFCDAFVEEGAFTADETRRIMAAARQGGLDLKLHVDQLREGGGAELAAEIGAVSADHLECISPAGIAALAASSVVAVGLPWASFYLQQEPLPARRLLDAGVSLAIATDFNPGTAPSYHLPMALLLAAVGCGLTAAELLRAATIEAARALRLEHEIGSLEVGKAADLLVVDAKDVGEWLYPFRPRAVVEVYCGGELVAPSGDGLKERDGWNLEGALVEELG